MSPTKSKKGLLESLKAITGPENVKVVCIGLAPGYRSLVRTLFPKARIVADKFHKWPDGSYERERKSAPEKGARIQAA